MTPIFPKSISDVQYIYRMSNTYIQRPISISYVQYIIPTSDIPALALALALALAQPLSEVRYCILDVGYRYRTSDIDIGRQIYVPGHRI